MRVKSISRKSSTETIKPTGQSTGLGLSYDIVKEHGGELKVETKEGVGSEFVINLTIK